MHCAIKLHTSRDLVRTVSAQYASNYFIRQHQSLLAGFAIAVGRAKKFGVGQADGVVLRDRLFLFTKPFQNIGKSTKKS